MSERIRVARARREFIKYGGDLARRKAEIAELPARQWNGVTVYTIHCRRGHDVEVVAELVWLIPDLQSYLCPLPHAEMPRV